MENSRMEALLSEARKKRLHVYIASPLTAFLPEIESNRLEQAADALAILTERFPDIIFFSPVLNSESWEMRDIKPGVGWYLYDAEFLKGSDYMIVLQLDGWDESFGIKFEKQVCEENDIFVEHCTMDSVHDKIFPWEDAYIPF